MITIIGRREVSTEEGFGWGVFDVEVDGGFKFDEIKFSFPNLYNRFVWIVEAWTLRTLAVCLGRISNSPV